MMNANRMRSLQMLALGIILGGLFVSSWQRAGGDGAAK
jgi:hypothetical protein